MSELEEGETLEIQITKVGAKGDGVGTVNGTVVFVPEAEKGETVEAKITSVGNNFAFAEKIKKDFPSIEEWKKQKEEQEKEQKTELESAHVSITGHDMMAMGSGVEHTIELRVSTKESLTLKEILEAAIESERVKGFSKSGLTQAQTDTYTPPSNGTTTKFRY